MEFSVMSRLIFDKQSIFTADFGTSEHSLRIFFSGEVGHFHIKSPFALHLISLMAMRNC